MQRFFLFLIDGARICTATVSLPSCSSKVSVSYHDRSFDPLPAPSSPSHNVWPPWENTTACFDIVSKVKEILTHALIYLFITKIKCKSLLLRYGNSINYARIKRRDKKTYAHSVTCFGGLIRCCCCFMLLFTNHTYTHTHTRARSNSRTYCNVYIKKINRS